MATDKSWINLRDRLSDEYWNGAMEFVKKARNFVNDRGLVRCPCKKCVNVLHQPIEVMEAHIIDHGFDPFYKMWVFHGEEDESTDQVMPEEGRVDNDEVLDVLNDFIGPLNDDGIRNDAHLDDDITSATMASDEQYEDLFAEVEAELYPGCTTFSSLNFLVKLMHLKVLHKWTNKSFDSLLKLLKDALPKANKLPASHYDAKKWMSKLGLGYQSIHVCKFDCALFWKEYATLEKCPVCGESRWIDSNTKGKKVPHKVLRYFPVTPRLKRLYGSRHTAKHMRWHFTGRSTEEGVLRHPVDGKAWQDFDKRHPDFASEARNVRLSLAADGFNPFGNMSLSYSMWPVVLTTYNLPPWLCMKESFFMLSLLIPGPQAPGKDIDVFLRPLIDELKQLWECGVETRDAEEEKPFKLRAALLWTVNDFPARSSLSGWSGQGYKACPTCNEETPSIRVIGKTAYVGHRRFLAMNDSLRRSKKFDGKVEKRPRPRRLSNNEIQDQLSRLPFRHPGKHEKFGGVKRKRGVDELNWTKKSIFFELPYWSENLLKHNLDVMHVEKNVCEALLATILGLEKSKDTDNARRDLKKLKIRPELHLYEEGNKLMKPHAPFTLTTEERRKFCQFIKTVKFPDGFASNLAKNVLDNDSKIIGLKSHDCHVIIQRLLVAGVRSFLNKDISITITEFCNFFKLICSRTLNTEDIEKTEKDIVYILCKLEQIFPPAFFDIMIHLVLHLPEEAMLGGPVHFRWMYPYERYIKKLKDYVRNRARPEGSIAEGYVVDEALTFCSMYLKGVQTKFNRPERNQDVTASGDGIQLSVFKSRARPIGKQNFVQLDEKLRTTAIWYILNNCPEIQKYLE